jgi:serine phosphatase RsbU (regulator of sigma subunit)
MSKFVRRDDVYRGASVGASVSVNAVADPSPVMVPDGGPGGMNGAETAARPASRVAHVNVVVVVVVGVLITAGLSVGARAVHNSNENRLLRQRAREVAAVAAAAIPTVQTPLASAAVLAEATNGNVVAFRQFMTPLVGAGRSFASVSLWPSQASSPRPLVVVGAQPELATETPSDISDFLARAAGRGTVTINDLLGTAERRLGYALSAASRAPRFVVYAEAALPKDRKATIAKDSAFADLGYALYLGRSADPQSLLASSTGGAVLPGRTASVTVPFGDSQLLVVLTPHTELGGTLLARLWWMLGILGLVLTLGAASLVERLTRRRLDAERLAGENARLYAQQRSVARTLQHSLLAEAFPEIDNLECAARYIAGVPGIDIGGDWYDVVRLERGNILFVVGDVSGRGLEAATMMASLRYAARAYAAEGHAPNVILSKLSRLVSVARDGHFATVLCGLLDVADGRITVANAGHPEPLLITPTGAAFVPTDIGVPVGVDAGTPYAEVDVSFPHGSTMLFYTDGAIERRGEPLDVGLQRLKDLSVGVDGPLEEFLSKIVDGVTAAGTEDDTALLAVRWRH